MPASVPTTVELLREVERLKRERDAVVLAHYYAPPEVQDAADHVGDSLALARLAVGLPQRVVAVCGVSFMGESVKLLNPDKTVLLPEPAADCPMAHMVERADVERARAEHEDLAVVCYVNTTAEVKAWSDVCVTSSNAVEVCASLPQREILFVPDANLGRHVAAQLPDKHVILHDGCCPHHQGIDPREVAELRAAHPQAPVAAHPECPPEVLEQADYVGSTKGIVAFAEEVAGPELVVLTVEGVAHEIARRRPDLRVLFPRTTPRCPGMDSVTLERLVAALRGEVPEVALPACAERARAALDAMLERAGR